MNHLSKKYRKRKILLSIVIVSALGLWIAQKVIPKKATSVKNAANQVEGKFYWTCPMHTQIHMDHPGECPICHMKLVKVSEQTKS